MNKESLSITRRIFGDKTFEEFYQENAIIDFFSVANYNNDTFFNNSSSETVLKFVADPPLEQSIESLFQHFISVSYHGIPYTDIRLYPKYYLELIFRYSNFFLFHGVGSCINMAIFFKYYVHLNINYDLDICYVSHPSKNFSHAFCYDNRTGMVYDPDFKIIAHRDAYGDISTWSWGLNVLEHATPHLKSKLPQNFLPVAMEKYLDIILSTKGREYSKSEGNKEKFHVLMKESLSYDWEKINLEINDYAWKTNFRNVRDVISEKRQDFNSIFLTLPPRSSLHFSYDFRHKNNILNTLLSIYFGRSVCSLSVQLAPHERCRLEIFDIPVLITSDTPDDLIINNNSLSFSEGNNCYYAKPKEVEKIIKYFSIDVFRKEKYFNISSNSERNINIYYLFNPMYFKTLKCI